MLATIINPLCRRKAEHNFYVVGMSFTQGVGARSLARSELLEKGSDKRSADNREALRSNRSGPIIFLGI